jgi:hypothetical protein
MNRLFFILAALLSGNLWASDVLIDSVPTAVLDTTDPYTLSCVVGNNANRFLIVAGTQREPNINNVTASAFNTTESCTKLGSQNGSSGNLNVTLWYRLSPSVTTANATLTGGNAANTVIGAISAYNVNQSTPFRDQSGANYKQTTVSATTTASLTMDTIAGDLVVAVILAGNSVSNVTNLVPGGSQVEKWDVANGGLNFARGGASTLLASGTSTVMSYTWTNNEVAVLMAFVLTPVSGAGPLFKRYYDMLRSSLFVPRLRFQG